MFTTTNIVVFIVLAIVCVFVTSAIRVYRKDRAAALDAQYDITMDRHYEATKSQMVKISDRITGQITNHKVHWLNVTDHGKVRTYLRYEDLLAAEELSPDEKDELESMDRHLQRVRDYREEKANIPIGYIVHKHPRFGKMVQYTNGLKVLGDRNKVAVVVNINESKCTFITEVHISLNLGVELADVYKIADKEGVTNENEWNRFQEEYLKNEEFFTSFKPEFECYNKMVEEMKYYNEHVKHVKFDDQKVAIEYRGERVSPRDQRHDYKAADHIPVIASVVVEDKTEE